MVAVATVKTGSTVLQADRMTLELAKEGMLMRVLDLSD